MTRHWALRMDQSNREFMWRELREGCLRQGWGYRSDQTSSSSDACTTGRVDDAMKVARQPEQLALDLVA